MSTQLDRENPSYAYPPTLDQPSKKRPWVKRHKFLTSIGVLAILGVIGSAAGSTSTTTAPSTSPISGGSNGSLAMAEWAVTNAPKIEMMTGAFDQISSSATSGDLSGTLAGCRSLRSKVADFESTVLPTPDPELTQELSQAMNGYSQGANDCLAGRFGAVAVDLSQANSHINAATARLKAFTN